jgi:cytochrome P450
MTGTQTAPSTATFPLAEIATPAGKPKGATALFAWRSLPLLAARIGIRFARMRRTPLRIGSLVLAIRHRHVSEVLARDLDFRIASSNAPRFDEIGYHFILGMDRSVELADERQVLYTALSAVNFAKVRAQTQAEIERRLEGKTQIDAVEDLARPAAALTAQQVFGIAPADYQMFVEAVRSIFNHCFLNASGDVAVTERAKRAAKLLDGWFLDEIARRRADAGGFGADMMGALLRAGASDDLTRRSLGGMLVGSIDTTTTVVAKVISEMMRDPVLLAAASRDALDPSRLYGWCQDALRRWPQTPILGRQAEFATELDGTKVPVGARVLMWTQAAMFDASVFADPKTMRPDRLVGNYLHLGGGLHPCAGRAINAWQIPMIVGALLKRRPRKLGKMLWAGPFPAHLPIELGGAA